MSTSDATPTEPEPIAVGRLIAATWREAWRTWPVLWPAWLLSAGLQAPIEVTFRLARPAGEGPGGSFAERLANSGLSSFVGAVVLALVLPVLLRQQERIGRLSRGHVDVMRGYVLVMLGFSLVTELAWTGVEGLSLAPLPASAAGLAMLFVSFMGLAP